MASVYLPVHRPRYAWLVLSFIFVFGLAIALFFYSSRLTGNATSPIAFGNEVVGQPLDGTVSYDLASHDAIPSDSQATLTVNTYTKTLPLSSVVSNGPLVDSISFAPTVDVLVVFNQGTPSSGDNASSSGDSGISNPPYCFKCQDWGMQQIPNDGIPVDYVIYDSGVSSDESYALVKVRAGTPVTIPIPQNYIGVIQQVNVRGQSIDASNVHLEQIGTSATLTSTYVEQVPGFSSSPTTNTLDFDLSRFGFLIPAGRTDVSFSVAYQGDMLLSSVSSFVATSAQNTSFNQSTIPSRPPTSTSTGGTGHTVSLSYSSESNLLFNAPPQDEPDCQTIVCTAYGACSAPALAALSTDVSQYGYVHTRTCLCQQTGASYTEQQSCPIPTNPITIVSSTLPGTTHASTLTGGLPMPPLGEPHAWRQTYSYSSQDLRDQSSIVHALSVGTRIELQFAGVSHSIGVEGIHGNTVDVLLASSPQPATLTVGDTHAFSIDGDTTPDIKVTVSSIDSDGNAVIRVEPYQAGTFSALVSAGEKAVTIIDQRLHQPVAHVILNEQTNSLRIFLVQSADSVPAHCYDTVHDADETGLDCGGADCSVCKVDTSNMPLILSWAVFVWILGFLFFIISKRAS